MNSCVLTMIAALAVSAMSTGQAAETDGDFVPVNPRNYPLDLRGRITKPTCVDIPEDLSLCQNIGYGQMRMPNLLDHDTMEEVKLQAQSWVPLLLQRCHAGTQLFLCTLFAPVCLDRPIYPCRSLCEEVQAGCGPLMESNCFPWPDMLDCRKFPPDNDLCIKSEMREQNGTAAAPSFEISAGTPRHVLHEQYMTLFTQCHDNSSPETLKQKFCTSDFVLKLKFKKVRNTVNDGKKYIGDSNPKKLEILKQGSLKKKDLKRLTFYVREGANCRCTMLENSRNYLLVMGHRDQNNPRKIFMTFVHTWEKTREFRRAVKSFEDPDSCANLSEIGAAAGGGRRRDENVNSEAPPNTQDAEPQEVTQVAHENFPVDQTNAPPHDSIPTVDHPMSDETPRTTSRRPNSKRNKRRRRPKERKRQRKSHDPTESEVPVSGM